MLKLGITVKLGADGEVEDVMVGGGSVADVLDAVEALRQKVYKHPAQKIPVGTDSPIL